jgi:type IV pilus assembly protein PilA
MLTAVKQRLERDKEEGFTLIELMVVLLIIAILLAIAIPTFLGARNTANARSTQENLRNALTAEQTNWTNNQAFAANLSTIEPSLNWAGPVAQGGNTVAAVVGGSSGTDTQQVSIQGWAKDGNCYAIFQSNDPAVGSGSFTSYAAWKNSAAACTTTVTAPTGVPTTGQAGTGLVLPTATTGWYTSF